MKKLAFTTLLIVAFPLFFFAQTPNETLVRAYDEYQAFKTYAEGLKKATPDDLKAARKRLDNSVLLFQKVIREGNASEIRAARYYKCLYYYHLSNLYGANGEQAAANELEPLYAPEMTAYKESDFPFDYLRGDKKYKVNWHNISATQANFYFQACQTNFFLGKYEEAIAYGNAAINHPNSTAFAKYVTVVIMIEMANDDPDVMEDAELLDYALQCVQMYDQLNETDKKQIETEDLSTTELGAVNLVELPDESATGFDRIVKAAPIAFKYDDSRDEAVSLYKFYYDKKGTNAGEAFHHQALSNAKTYYSTNRSDAQAIGRGAIAALTPKTAPSDCAIFKELADAAGALGMPMDKAKFEKSFQECSKKMADEAAAAEAARKKAAAKANRKFSVYAGLDIMPLLKKSPDDMDFGGHLDLRGRKVAHSFGFSKVQNRRDINSDATHWDGRRFFYAPKFFGRKGAETVYFGPFFGYAEKNLEPQVFSIVTASDGTAQSMTLSPVDKQYELMLNYGLQLLGRGIGMDLWMGAGGSYNQLSYKELPNAKDYTISGSEFFTARKPKEVFFLQVRMGLSVGLALGKPRL